MNPQAVNEAQAAVEALALELMAQAAVLAVRDTVREEYRKRPGADSEDGLRHLDRVADETTFAAMLAVAGSDAAHPRIVWFNNPPHTSHGVDVPGGRFGFDNTDRVYRYFATHPDYSYELRGYHPDPGEPINLLLEACEDKPPAWGYPLVFLFPQDIEVNEAGSFLITVDSSPAEGRKNHLQIPPGSGHVVIRDTITDWASDSPSKLTVKRVSGPERPPLTFEELAANAPQMVLDQAKYGLEWYDADTGFSGPGAIARNTIPSVYVRPTTPGQRAWGMIGVGKYSITGNQALVFTLEVQQASYLGLMITDPWMLSIEFATRTSSLNNLQAWISPDDTITYVVAAGDPGVHNWLDSGGIHDGVMLIRWEQMATEPQPGSAVGEVKLVKLSDLEGHLPAAMPRLSPAERQAQVKERTLAYKQRQAYLLASQHYARPG